MPYTVLDMTPEELMRVEAWCICLRDASLYIELAQSTGIFLTAESSMLVPFKGHCFSGHLKIAPLIERGMVAAAIVLTGSIYKSGYAGHGVAKNVTQNLKTIRERAETFSDKFNGWPNGQTSKVFRRYVEAERDGFLAHYDGSRANIVHDPLDGTLSWQPPSPWYDPSAFEDMKMAICAMLKGLSQFLHEERELSVQES